MCFLHYLDTFPIFYFITGYLTGLNGIKRKKYELNRMLESLARIWYIY